MLLSRGVYSAVRVLTVRSVEKNVCSNFASTEDKNKKLEERRKELMSKGLPKVKPIQGVKHIILVCSGKGGVGKSTIAVNLATALKIIEPQKNVGLLDTDIFGPSIPLMMNLNETPFLTDKNLMEPLVNYGVKCMSMGFLVEQNTAIIWRGLMVMQAMEKLMRQVDWGELDYLVVDTPPGTGDTQLSLVQNLPISGVILVTTPQRAALQVTKRGASMFKKLNIPLVGMVENMSSIVCPSCEKSIKIFGEETKNLAKDLDIELLESFPLEGNISERTDQGVPVVLEDSMKESVLYKNLASSVVKFLSNKK